MFFLSLFSVEADCGIFCSFFGAGVMLGFPITQRTVDAQVWRRIICQTVLDPPSLWQNLDSQHARPSLPPLSPPIEVVEAENDTFTDKLITKLNELDEESASDVQEQLKKGDRLSVMVETGAFQTTCG
jgi:hypothetical protein